MKFKTEIYKPPIGGGDWQVSIPEFTGYFSESGRGWNNWLGNTELKILGLKGRDYGVKYDHESNLGFTSTKYPLIDTGFKMTDFTVGEQYQFTVEVYIDGDLKYQQQKTLEVYGTTGQIVIS